MFSGCLCLHMYIRVYNGTHAMHSSSGLPRTSSSIYCRVCSCVGGQFGGGRRWCRREREDSAVAGREAAPWTQVSRGVSVTAGGNTSGDAHPRKVLGHSAEWGWVSAVLPRARCELCVIVVVKKVAHTRLPSVGFRSWCWFLAVSLQMIWVINLAVGCRYFPPGPQLPSQPLRELLPISQLGEQRHDGCEQFA